MLLPPRIAGIRGAEIAGSVLPAYDVGGDWFEHIADRGGAWLAVADAAGKGPRASALSALTLAALRATREAGGSLAEAAAEMDRAILGFGDPSMFVTALLARWNYADSTLEWLTFGHPQPCRITADGVLDDLSGAVLPPLGLLSGQPLAPHARLAPARRPRRLLLRRRDRAPARRRTGSASTACTTTSGQLRGRRRRRC